MANTKFQIKRSVVPGKTPQSSDLEIGELAINLSDAKIFSKHSLGNIVVLSDYELSNSAFNTAQSALAAANNASNLSSGTVPGDRGVTAGSAVPSFIEYNGLTKTTGQFDGGSTAPTNTTRLNYDGNFYATTFYGAGTGLTGTASNLTANVATYEVISNATSGTYYPQMVSGTSGNLAGFANNAFAFDIANGRFGIGTSSPTSKLEISDSWNNSGTIYTGIKYNTINTASSSSSSLLDLQIDGTSRFKVIRGSGKTYINGNAITLYNENNNSFNSVISHSGNESLHFIEYGQNVLFLSGLDFTPSVQIPSNKSFGWSSSSSQSTSGDLVFYRDSAGVFAQRNGTNQQTYRLYSSYINSSNTSYVETTANTSLGYIINCANNGTQTIPPNNLLDLRLNSTSKFYINNSGGVYANTLVLTANTASTNTTTGTLVVTGGVGISGALNATTKSFDIVHPSNPDKRLRYGSLESPSHSVRLTGRSIIINGKATVELPYYLRDLVHEEDVNIQLTNIKHGEIIWVDEINISENYFTVGCKDSRELEFFWDITCERKDVDRLVVEE